MTAPADLDAWRARALRYTVLYLLLALALMGVRYTSRDVRPDLLAARAERAQLQTTKAALEVEVQARTSVARVQAWAREHGMVDFARTRKETASFKPLPRPPAVPDSTPLEVTTSWR